jgi:Mlc titration factor MtfA (ptsG expression regulator)
MEWREAIKQPFPAAWRTILERDVPFYTRFDAATRTRFEDQVKLFVLTKEFVGTDGVSVDDAMKIVVAATACRLTVNLPGEQLGRLRYITIRPETFSGDSGKVVGTAHRNKVTLSWAALMNGLRDPSRGHNVAYHEFAHVLDGADGTTDGVPRFSDPSLNARWAETLEAELSALRAAQREGVRTLLREYGASDPTEYFAVATETFFSRPRAMQRHHPRLYQLLSEYFQQDPSAASEETDESLSRLSPTTPPSPEPSRHMEQEPVTAEIQRRAEHQVAQLGAGPAAPPSAERRIAQRARLAALRDPDGWRACNIVRLIGGLLIAIAVALFIAPLSPEDAQTLPGSAAWSRLILRGGFGWIGPLLLVVGISLLWVGSLMDRYESL